MSEVYVVRWDRDTRGRRLMWAARLEAAAECPHFIKGRQFPWNLIRGFIGM